MLGYVLERFGYKWFGLVVNGGSQRTDGPEPEDNYWKSFIAKMLRTLSVDPFGTDSPFPLSPFFFFARCPRLCRERTGLWTGVSFSLEFVLFPWICGMPPARPARRLLLFCQKFKETLAGVCSPFVKSNPPRASNIIIPCNWIMAFKGVGKRA